MIYGEDRTIHSNGYFDVEVRNGKVVAVWFRCQPVPFKQSKASKERAKEMTKMYEGGVSEVDGILINVEDTDDWG